MSEKQSARLRTDKIYNLHIVNADDCASCGVPQLKQIDVLPKSIESFNYFSSTKKHIGKDVFCHFFIDDYQFERVWKRPERYLSVIKRFGGALTPDFSLYLDMPEPMQRWNIYRQRAISYYWQLNGVDVVPVVSWAKPDSYDFCFDGLPKHSTIAASTVGVMRDKEALEFWKLGMREALERLEPLRVLLYGADPGFDFGDFEVVRYQHGIRERTAKNG